MLTMLNKKCLAAVMLAALGVSATAMADDRGVNTVAGAVIGAAIGHNSGSRNGAAVGGVVGAVIGSSLPTRDDYYAPRGGYGAPVVYESRAYPPVVYDSYAPAYYAPAPVYYAPAPVYYGPRYYGPAVSVYYDGGRRYYGGRGYDDHGHDHGHRR